MQGLFDYSFLLEPSETSGTSETTETTKTSKTDNRAEILAALGITEDYFNSALENGEDIEINTDRLFGDGVSDSLWGSLRDEITVEPGGMSIRQAREITEQNKGNPVREDFDNYEAETQRTIEAIESGKKVEANIKAKMTATGLIQEDVADSTAKLFASHIMISANRMGISPEEYYRIYANIQFKTDSDGNVVVEVPCGFNTSDNIRELFQMNPDVDINEKVTGIVISAESYENIFSGPDKKEPFDAGKVKEKDGKHLFVKAVAGVYRNEDTGWDISVSGANVDHAVNTATANGKKGNSEDAVENRLSSKQTKPKKPKERSGVAFEDSVKILSALPDIVKYAKLIESHDDYLKRYEIKKVHRMYASIRLAEKIDKVYTVKMTVRELRNGKREAEIDSMYIAYDTNVIKEEKVSDVLTPTRISKEIPIGNTPNTFRIRIGDMLRGVKDNSEVLFISPDSEQIYNQTAYHGSRFKFKRFSLKKMGLGAGAQAHGRGLYFAKDKFSANDYRISLAGNHYTYHGKSLLSLLSILERREEYDKYSIIEDFLVKQHIDGLDFNDYDPEVVAWFKEIYPDIKGQGQLYEVEIPDDDVLLDEQKTLKEQPENVQKVLAELGYSFNDTDTGSMIYDKLSEALGNDKAASDFLFEHGIKGISYDGGQQDGRCFVIFTDKDVEITNTLYQELRTKGTDSLKAALPDIVLNSFDKAKSYLKQQIAALPKKGVTSESDNIFASLGRNGIDEMLSKRASNKSQNNGFTMTEHITAAANILKLFRNAELIKQQPDEHKRRGVTQIKLFGAPIILSERKEPAIAYITVREVYDKDNKLYSVELIDFNLVQEKIKDPPSIVGADLTDNGKVVTPLEGHYRLSDKYNSVKNELVKLRQGNLSNDDYRGSIAIPSRFGEQVPIRITLTPNADASTTIHEMSHFFLWETEKLSQQLPGDFSLQADLNTLKNWLGWEDWQTGWTRDQQEKFASTFEAYLRDGKAPSQELVSVFARFKKWLCDIYKSIKELGITEQLSEEVRGVFDRMVATDEQIEEAFMLREGTGAAEISADNSVEGIVEAEGKRMREGRAEQAKSDILAKAVGDIDTVRKTKRRKSPLRSKHKTKA